MKFYPVEKILKNGKTVIIREANKKDAEALLQTVSKYLIESTHLLTTIEEFNPTIKEQKNWIQTLNGKRNCLLLVATYNNKIIASIDLKGEPRKKTAHNALLGIGILKEWQSVGLGMAMMESAINWARQSLSLEYLWLHVFAMHPIAIGLYKKMGFENICVQKNFVKDTDGSYIDNIIMRLDVRNILPGQK